MKGYSVTLTGVMGFLFYANTDQCKLDLTVKTGTLGVKVKSNRWGTTLIEREFNPVGADIRATSEQVVLKWTKSGATLELTLDKVKDGCCLTHWSPTVKLLSPVWNSDSISLGQIAVESDGLCPA
jgi:hypothetical protein